MKTLSTEFRKRSLKEIKEQEVKIQELIKILQKSDSISKQDVQQFEDLKHNIVDSISRISGDLKLEYEGINKKNKKKESIIEQVIEDLSQGIQTYLLDPADDELIEVKRVEDNEIIGYNNENAMIFLPFALAEKRYRILYDEDLY